MQILNGLNPNDFFVEYKDRPELDRWILSKFNKPKEGNRPKEDRFIVANHGECDHSGSLTTIMDEIPDTPIYCTANAVKSIEGQYGKAWMEFQM